MPPKKDKGVKVHCFFCKELQMAQTPPCLHTCVKCKKDFRVIRDKSIRPSLQQSPPSSVTPNNYSTLPYVD